MKKLALALTLLLAFPVLPSAALGQQTKAAATAKDASSGKVTLDFKDVELTDLIQTISELTGRNFVYDDSVKGKVTIISPEPMSLDQAYHLFLTVLNVKGFTLVPSGRINKIVALRDAKESNLPIYTGTRDGRAGDQIITRVISLENVDATVLATTVLAPLVPKTSNIVAYPPSNTLVITDSAANIERLLTIIREIDQPSSLDMLEVITLQYADATELSQIATQILSQAPGAVARRTRAPQAVAGQEVSKVIPYTRTNSLVVLATKEDLQAIHDLVARLDRKPAEIHAGIYVYYLENADAETLAKTLNEIVTGIKAKARTTRQPQPGQPAQAAQALEAVAITADKPTNALIINSSPEDYETLREIIAQLDLKRKQVFVEALIMELSMDATRELGASLQGAVETGDRNLIFGTSNLNSGSVNLGSLTPPSGSEVPSLLTQSVNGLLLGGLFSPVKVTQSDGTVISVPALSALIQLSKTDSDINILSAPRLLTSDNEEAEIIVGSNVPIITQRLTDTGASSGLAQSVAIERQDVALTLRFTPQITEGDLVRLNVFQEITDIAQNSVGDVNQVGPTLTKRQLRNTVLAENGRTVVLGGLIQTNKQETVSKVPILGDIPLLGWLFKSRSNTERKTNLLIFMTPRIVKDAEDLAKVTRRSKDIMDQFEKGVAPTVNLEVTEGETPVSIEAPAPPPEGWTPLPDDTLPWREEN